MTPASRIPRGWIVAVRPKGSTEPYTIAYEGSVFCDKEMARRKAASWRDVFPELQVRVLPEGLVK